MKPAGFYLFCALILFLIIFMHENYTNNIVKIIEMRQELKSMAYLVGQNRKCLEDVIASTLLKRVDMISEVLEQEAKQ